MENHHKIDHALDELTPFFQIPSKLLIKLVTWVSIIVNINSPAVTRIYYWFAYTRIILPCKGAALKSSIWGCTSSLNIHRWLTWTCCLWKFWRPCGWTWNKIEIKIIILQQFMLLQTYFLLSWIFLLLWYYKIFYLRKCVSKIFFTLTRFKESYLTLLHLTYSI